MVIEKCCCPAPLLAAAAARCSGAYGAFVPPWAGLLLRNRCLAGCRDPRIKALECTRGQQRGGTRAQGLASLEARPRQKTCEARDDEDRWFAGLAGLERRTIVSSQQPTASQQPNQHCCAAALCEKGGGPWRKQRKSMSMVGFNAGRAGGAVTNEISLSSSSCQLFGERAHACLCFF